MGSIHALIIDDNVKNVNVMAQLLQMQGATSTRLTNPVQIFGDTLNNIGKVDVVFLDLEMPGMDGFAVHETLKDDERFASVPIVACTVHGSEINAVYKRGFQGFIGKPLDSDRFPDQLKRILIGESVWEAI